MVTLLTLITGIVYPSVVTLLAQILFNTQANGSLIMQDDTVVGSELIGQQFSDAKYFWGRPSATTPMPYNAANSNGSNMGPANPALLAVITQRVADITKAHPEAKNNIPIELVTTSASGLDPHIGVQAAYYQAQRIANVRKLPLNDILKLIDTSVRGTGWGIFGVPRINVLQLNLSLDKLERTQPK